MRIFSLFVSIALLWGASAACATKTYVNTRIGERIDEVDGRVDTVSQALEENEHEIDRNAARISEVDQTANAASRSAAAASDAARAAGTAAAEAGARADALGEASRRLIYEVMLSDEQTNFPFGGATLPEDAKTKIDALVQQITSHPVGVYFEIEGHTDSTGTDDVNDRLGLERAEAVKRYLHEKHRLPLHKINVISYGEGKPVAPNTTREGRAQNRRVVIKVLA